MVSLLGSGEISKNICSRVYICKKTAMKKVQGVILLKGQESSKRDWGPTLASVEFQEKNCLCIFCTFKYPSNVGGFKQEFWKTDAQGLSYPGNKLTESWLVGGDLDIMNW